ncbi:MAG TPA: hypothetical protein VLC09_02820 [Polyangiaceae bacterium]|nr:hypothetical protein [Polyangiaceae bacterium]
MMAPQQQARLREPWPLRRRVEPVVLRHRRQPEEPRVQELAQLELVRGEPAQPQLVQPQLPDERLAQPPEPP